MALTQSEARALVLELDELRRTQKEIADRVKEIQSNLLTSTDEIKPFVDSGDVVTVTKVTPTSFVLDEDALRRKIGVKRWQAVTVRVLSKDQLRAAVKAGEIAATTVAMCSSEREGTAYLKVSRKKNSEGLKSTSRPTLLKRRTS